MPRTRQPGHAPTRRAPATDPGTPRLSPERAFVVQLEPPAPAGRRTLRGKVEHLATGEARHFATLAALVGFMNRFRGGVE